jgi:hypothetical protein
MFNYRRFRVISLLLFVAITTATPCAHSDWLALGKPNGELERSQALLFSLQKAPMSAGFYILHSLRTAEETGKDLDKALKQIEAADATYAKARNRPNQRYLSTTSLKLTLARQTAAQLRDQLEDSWDELKNSIKQTLVTDPNFKL